MGLLIAGVEHRDMKDGTASSGCQGPVTHRQESLEITKEYLGAFAYLKSLSFGLLTVSTLPCTLNWRYAA